MMKKAEKNRKGFTLVELIVVLVILAILAAILVPALLGWVDEARKAQDIVNARALMTAVQAQMTEEYGNGAKDFSHFGSGDDAKDIFFKNNPSYPNFTTKVFEQAGVEEPFLLLFYTQKVDEADIATGGTDALHEAYRVISTVYWSTPDSKPLFYDFINGVWTEGSPYSADLIVRGDNKIQDGPLKNKNVRVCIVGGTSKHVKWNSNSNTRINDITYVNNMILHAMDYNGTKNKGKNDSSGNPAYKNIKIE